MKIIFSPTKTMVIHSDIKSNQLELSSKTISIINALKALNKDELSKMYKVSDSILNEAINYLENIDNKENITPAIYAYDGIQYQYLDVKTLGLDELSYLESNMYIVSALYGLVKPFDGINQYRLDLNNKLKIESYKNLYDFYGNSLYEKLYKKKDIVINLCSEEYSKIINKYLKKDDVFINVSFLENNNGKLSEKGVYCKMARGLLCRYLAINKADKIEDIIKFNDNGYKYDSKLSSNNHLVFVR